MPMHSFLFTKCINKVEEMWNVLSVKKRKNNGSANNTWIETWNVLKLSNRIKTNQKKILFWFFWSNWEIIILMCLFATNLSCILMYIAKKFKRRIRQHSADNLIILHVIALTTTFLGKWWDS